jgi:predicted alpha/beta hydrolase
MRRETLSLLFIMDATQETFEIKTSDGRALAATIYAARSDVAKGQTVLVSGATGVPQKFYSRFSLFLARAGYDVVTFDFRTIGLSHVADIRSDRTTFLEWGSIDIPSALEFCKLKWPRQKIKIVGHSGGAWLLAINSNWQDVTAVYSVAAGSLFWKRMTAPERYRLFALWKFVVPTLARVFGYVPGKFGLGADLTRSHAEQWARWCLDPNGAFGDPKFKALFSNPTVPITAVSIYDDPWETVQAVKDYYDRFTQAKIKYVEMSKEDVSGRSIGHFGFFKSTNEVPLWNSVLTWLA